MYPAIPACVRAPGFVLGALLVTSLAAYAQPVVPSPAAPFPVSIQVDATKSVGEMKPFWRFFGADEPNYATMKDGRKLIAELGELRPKDSPQPTYFRAHNLLTSGDTWTIRPLADA